MDRRSPLWIGTLILAGTTPWASGAEPAGKLVSERWESAYVGSDKIGHVHWEVREVSANGRPVLHARQYSMLSIKRFNQSMEMESVGDSFELPDGRLYAVDVRTRLSNEVTRTQGNLSGPGKFRVTVEHKGSKLTQEIDWPAGVLGPYAQEKSLRDKPLAEGESRTFLTFLPELNVVAQRILTAHGMESTTLADGTAADLRRIVETNDKVALESSLWVDEAGDVVKMALPLAGIEMITYRTTKEEALRAGSDANMDFGFDTLVKPDKPVPGPHTASSVTYRFTFADEPAAAAIPASRHQRILSRDKNVLVVREERAAPTDDPPSTNPVPGPEFLGDNTYIQPSNPKIQAIAKSVTKDADSAWEKVRLLEEWVDNNMTNQDFSIGFAASSEIIETRQGDCTEHAVLLAALCRAVGIPARVAMGLVYLEGSGAFGYHMWTEVFLNGDWYAVDGTLGRGGIGGGHIKIADGSLEGAQANSTFLPIFKVIGKLKIELLEVDPS